MASLSKNWITEPHIDLEYKQYVLLAYLQQVDESFTANKLYPHLSELVNHYRELKFFKETRSQFLNAMPGKIAGVDLERFKLIYDKLTQDDEVMQVIMNIVNYSLPKFETWLQEGKKIYDLIESNLAIFPIGIVPLHKESGYVMLYLQPEKTTRVYEYQLTVIENPNDKYRGIHFSYVTVYDKSIVNTFESIKAELIQHNKQMPNPATYVISSKLHLPFEETFLPVAKREFMRVIATT
ncbi:MAG: hypothetical protein RIQ89_1198 [Bacteroidota bacterium]|jgi:hypothetical protein